MEKISAVDVSKLPAYTGGQAGADGYALFKVSAVRTGAKLTDEKRAQIAAAYQRSVQEADVVSLMVALRNLHPVKIAKRAEADKP